MPSPPADIYSPVVDGGLVDMRANMFYFLRQPPCEFQVSSSRFHVCSCQILAAP